MTTPAFTARMDQAAAAADHLASLLDADTAAGIMETFSPELTSGHLQMMLALPLRILTGETVFCDHLVEQPEQIGFWAARKPGRIRCALCARRFTDRDEVSTKQRKCDRCGKGRRRLREMAQMIPAAANPKSGYLHGPILLVHQLCDACLPAQVPDAA